ADRNRSHWSTSKTPSYTKSVSWQHHRNVASISLGNESFSTDEDLEYGYLMNTGNHYDVYLPPELFAQAYKLNNKEMNAQLDYLNRYAI
ncbi:hypothetical protein PO431_22485, partial [Escherichia coli]